MPKQRLEQLSDAQLQGHLLTTARKIHVLKAVTKGARIHLERRFQLELTKFLQRWYQEIAADLSRSGILQTAVTAARAFKRLPYTERQRRRQEANDEIRDIFAPYLSEALNSSRRRALHALHRRYVQRFYDLGAVVGLQAMGFNATSKRFGDFEKSALVSKAADSLVFELADEELIAAIENRTIEFGAGITETTIKDARALVRDKVYFGSMGTQELGEQIAAANGIPEWRGIKIARTEAQQSFNTAQYKMYERRQSAVEPVVDRWRPSRAPATYRKRSCRAGCRW